MGVVSKDFVAQSHLAISSHAFQLLHKQTYTAACEHLIKFCHLYNYVGWCSCNNYILLHWSTSIFPYIVPSNKIIGEHMILSRKQIMTSLAYSATTQYCISYEMLNIAQPFRCASMTILKLMLWLLKLNHHLMLEDDLWNPLIHESVASNESTCGVCQRCTVCIALSNLYTNHTRHTKAIIHK